MTKAGSVFTMLRLGAALLAVSTSVALLYMVHSATASAVQSKSATAQLSLIFFGLGSIEVDPAGLVQIQIAAKELNSTASREAILFAHNDPSGSSEVNKALDFERLAAVKLALEKASASRAKTILCACGSAYAVSGPAWRNRRVELVIGSDIDIKNALSSRPLCQEVSTSK
jgi:outer membrane protein OmpA-like peptidoglycan-associated protein